MLKELVNIGVVVRDIEEAVRRFQKNFGATVVRPVAANEGLHIRFAVLSLAGAEFELFSPDPGEPVLSKFLETRGEGLYRLAFVPDGFDAALAECDAKGIRYAQSPFGGDGDTRLAFLSPRAANGVLVELMERPFDPLTAPAAYDAATTPQEGQMLSKLLNIGVAVKDMDEAIARYQENFGATVVMPPAKNEPLQITFAVLKVADAEIELFSPLPGEPVLSKFLETRGEGLYRLAFTTDDMDQALEQCDAKGVRYMQAGGAADGMSRVAFLSPKAANGVMFELVQRAD